MIMRLFSTLAIFAIGVTLGVGNAGAQTICNGTLPAGTYASVTVPAGNLCFVSPSLRPGSVITVTGNVTVEQGAALEVGLGLDTKFIVNGNLRGVDARAIDLGVEGPASRIEIDGNVTLSGTTGEVLILIVFIGGNLQVLDSVGPSVDVISSNVSGNVLFQNNTSLSNWFISDNTIGGNLVCQDNAPLPPTNGGSPNTVGGNEIGQCKGL
jgi:hypothetical protein